MLAKIARPIVHAVTGTRKFYYSRLNELAKSSDSLKILEIGSGKLVKGEEAYSAKHIFGNASEFRQTDMNPSFGHEVLDITTMDIEAEYDMILCLNVLEHVYEYQLAVSNLMRALSAGGRLVVAVPFAFPLHDEPHDYFRFTRFALDRMLSDFNTVQIEVKGSSKMPFGHFAVASKH